MPSLPLESGRANRKLILPPQPFWHLVSSTYSCSSAITMRAPTTSPTRVPTPKRVQEKWIVDGAFSVSCAGWNKSKLTDVDGAIDVIAVRAPVRSPFCSLVRDWDRDRNVERRKTQGERVGGRESEGGNRSPRTTFQRHLPLSEKGRENHTKRLPLCVDTL